jgi:hypothetical protein
VRVIAQSRRVTEAARMETHSKPALQKLVTLQIHCRELHHTAARSHKLMCTQRSRYRTWMMTSGVKPVEIRPLPMP